MRLYSYGSGKRGVLILNLFYSDGFFDEADEERIRRFEELSHNNKIMFAECGFL